MVRAGAGDLVLELEMSDVRRPADWCSACRRRWSRRRRRPPPNRFPSPRFRCRPDRGSEHARRSFPAGRRGRWRRSFAAPAGSSRSSSIATIRPSWIASPAASRPSGLTRVPPRMTTSTALRSIPVTRPRCRPSSKCRPQEGSAPHPMGNTVYLFECPGARLPETSAIAEIVDVLIGKVVYGIPFWRRNSVICGG